eukprot:CAMPEP_0113953750 /NCGR_PEP_ID=MMETSP0011_2-20120614/17_1 /TAXON_ID=101924 /ORGANISM="Rhodosorus marinus" /LENGTH=181 /DNA_ID=CAMNT_0000962495 /DNA_START=136 /DNA_END=681 /DNA_ORIENTATION=+ /assembly_acc=CAM_ASM_000156
MRSVLMYVDALHLKLPRRVPNLDSMKKQRRLGRLRAEVHLKDACPVGDKESCGVCKSNLTPFRKRVLHALCHVPEGHFTTYGEIARELKSSPRAVGQALRRNPFNVKGASPRVPCHRVVATTYHLGGFSGVWNPEHENGIKKRNMLESEGLTIDEEYRVHRSLRQDRFVKAEDGNEVQCSF